VKKKFFENFHKKRNSMKFKAKNRAKNATKATFFYENGQK